MEMDETKEHAAWIGESVARFMASGENRSPDGGDEPLWAAPLVGFSRGSDPLYREIKELVGPFYWEPLDIFSATFPHIPVSAEELAVIAWILPQTGETKGESRKDIRYPSRRWTRSKGPGEMVNVKLRKYLVSLLADAGFEAVAPQLSPLWAPKVSERYGAASTWSERHAAFVSGLGTFGLCDGLITPAGKAMRCGSVVARLDVAPTARPYKDIHEYCLFLTSGLCGKCMERCPAGAITREGHDKDKCRAYMGTVTSPYAKEHYGMDIEACGLCQTKVPCESRIPVRERRQGGEEKSGNGA